MPRRRSAAVLFVLFITAGGAARADPALELEAFLGGAGGGLGGGGRIGVPIGRHLVLMIGAEGEGVGQDGYAAYTVRIPAELKIYLTSPRPGSISPLLRLGGAYSRSGQEMDGGSAEAVGVEGRGGLGLHYLISERFGVGVDAGLTYGRYRVETCGLGFFPGGDGWRLGLDWRVGVLFRL